MAKAPRRSSKFKRPARKYRRDTPVPRDLNTPVNIGVSGKAFPVTLNTDLKWGYTQSASVTDLEFQTARFRINSVYDPDFSAGALQTSAYGLDLFAGAYQKYEVKAVTIDVRMAPLNGGQAMTGAIMFLSGSDNVPSPATPDAVIARALTGTCQTFSQGHPYIFKRRYRLQELNNVIPALRQSNVGANPPLQELLAVVCLNPNTSTVTIWKTVKLIYHVQFSDRRQLTAQNV